MPRRGVFTWSRVRKVVRPGRRKGDVLIAEQIADPGGSLREKESRREDRYGTVTEKTPGRAEGSEWEDGEEET